MEITACQGLEVGKAGKGIIFINKGLSEGVRKCSKIEPSGGCWILNCKYEYNKFYNEWIMLQLI